MDAIEPHNKPTSPCESWQPKIGGNLVHFSITVVHEVAGRVGRASIENWLPPSLDRKPFHLNGALGVGSSASWNSLYK